MTVYLRAIAQVLFYTLALVLILAALTVASMRLITPIFDRYQPQLENWASQRLNLAVTVQKTRFTWSGYSPGLELTEVTIRQKQTLQPLLQVHNLKIFVSLLDSLWLHQAIVNQVMIKGCSLKLYQDDKQTLHLQGFPADAGLTGQPYQKETTISEMWSWLMTSARLNVKDINIDYANAAKQRYRFKIFQINLINQGSQHKLYAKAALEASLATEVILAAQWQGNALDLQKTQADFYLNINKLNLANWLDNKNWQNLTISNGLAALKLWGKWTAGRLNNLQTKFSAYDLIIKNTLTQQRQAFKRVSGHLGWQVNKDNSYTLSGDDILLDLNDHLWPATHFFLIYNLAPSPSLKQFEIGYFNAADTHQWLKFFSAQKFPELKPWLAYQLSGDVTHLTLVYQPNNWLQSHFDINVSNLSIQDIATDPAIKNLSAHMLWDGNKANITVQSKKVQIEINKIFAQPLKFNEVAGNLQLVKQNNAWQISTPQFMLDNDDLNAKISGSMLWNQTLTTKLQGNFAVARVANINHYLPAKMFSTKLNHWLHTAFAAGQVEAGYFNLDGNLLQFPFQNGNGNFLIGGALKNIRLYFAPDWPQIEQVNGTLQFKNATMTAHIANAQSLGVKIQNAQATINDLTGVHSDLQVQIKEFPLQYSRAKNYIAHTPLDKFLSPVLEQLSTAQPITLGLNFNLPLSYSNKLAVAGHLRFANNNLLIPNAKIKFEQLNGQLNFTEQAIFAQQLNANFLQKKLALTIKTFNNTISLSTQAELTVAEIIKWLNLPANKYISGKALMTTQLNIPYDGPMQLSFASDLQGVSVDLPKPFGKAATTKINFSANYNLTESLLAVHYGNLLQAALKFNPSVSENRLIAASFVLGDNDKLSLPVAGISVSGHLDSVNLDDMYSQPSTQFSLDRLPLNQININIDDLQLLDQHFYNLNTLIKLHDNKWQVQLNSKDLAGEVILPLDFNTNEKVEANLQRLHLHSPAATKQAGTKAQINWQKLPKLQIAIQELIYDAYPLGSLSLSAYSDDNLVKLSKVNLDSQLFNLHAQGSFNTANTYISGDITTKQLTETLKLFDFPLNNLISDQAHAEFSLSWPGLPTAVSSSSISGNAELTMGKGRLINIAATTGAKMDLGRMLTVFNLQTIPRRLSFDFSDLFESGYSFDSIKAKLNLSKGRIFLPDLKLDGPVAKVNLNGSISLIDKEYDLQLQIVPYVTSSIPVAAALITAQPLIGLAAYAVNSILTPQVSKVTSYYYKVTGPWHNPKWQAIKSSQLN